MKFNLLLFTLIGFLNMQVVFAQDTNVSIPFSYSQISTEGDLGDFLIEINTQQIEEGLEIIQIDLTSENPAIPPGFKLKWDFPSMGISQFWNSNISTDKVTYYSNDVRSRASSQVPLIDFIGNRDQNRFLFALSDALDKINTYTWLREEDRRFYCEVELFSEPHPAIRKYHLERFSCRRHQGMYFLS